MSQSSTHPAPQPPEALEAQGITAADVALFQSVSATLAQIYDNAIHTRCPQELVPGGVAYPRLDPPAPGGGPSPAPARLYTLRRRAGVLFPCPRLCS